MGVTVVSFLASAHENECVETGKITVTGSSSVSVTPDRITVEIGTREYYKKLSKNDSIRVSLAEIDKEVDKVLKAAGIPDSLVTINDVGNYYFGVPGEKFLMGKRISVTLTDLSQLQTLAEGLGFEGVTSFRISGTDKSDMESVNRNGLVAALRKAFEKASLLAENAGGQLGIPLEIIEDGPVYYEEALAVNTSLDGNVMYAAKAMSMDNMKKIVRRYNVRVTYQFIPLKDHKQR